MRTLSFFLLLVFFFVGCQSSGSGEGTEGTTETTAVEEPAAKKYTVTPFTPSASFPDAKIESVAYEGGKFSFGIGGESYELGVQTPDADQKMCANSGKGQHIHLIINDNPYVAKYTAEFEQEVEDGEQFMLAFLSRSYHESIKTPEAHVAMLGTFEDGSLKDSKAVTDPMLFYSRPKGAYVGEQQTDKVMLDFYLANVDLSAGGYTVKAEINGEEHLIEKWQPYYIEGLEMGDNTVKLTLLDKDGVPVATPLNPVERTFTLQELTEPGE